METMEVAPCGALPVLTENAGRKEAGPIRLTDFVVTEWGRRSESPPTPMMPGDLCFFHLLHLLTR